MAMRGLTLREPWATLVRLGAKRIETRSWSTRYRGPILIHASTTYGRDEEIAVRHPAFLDVLRDAGLITAHPKHGGPVGTFPLGKAIAIVDLVACIRVESLERTPLSVREHAFGNYEPGRFAWRLDNVRSIRPFPVRGALGLWKVDEAVAEHAIRHCEPVAARA